MNLNSDNEKSYDQWQDISSTYDPFHISNDMNIIHSYYHTNALQYFMAYFILCTDKYYMSSTHPHSHSDVYYINLLNLNPACKKHIDNKKEYYFNYALRYFFPNTVKNVLYNMPIYEQMGYLLFNKDNLFNYSLLEEIKESKYYDSNELDSFIKILIDMFIPQLQQYRLNFKKSYIRIMIDKIHKNIVNLNDVDCIEFYCICEDMINSKEDLSTLIDNHTVTFNSLKEMINKETFIDILYREYFIWNMNTCLHDLLSITNYNPACILNLVHIDNSFIQRLFSTLFFIITYNDGEKRIYFNNHSNGIKEIVKGTIVNDEIFGIMLNANTNDIYKVHNYKGLPNIEFNGDTDKFISEFTFYYSSVFEVINYMRHFFTYKNNDEKEVLFI